MSGDHYNGLWMENAMSDPESKEAKKLAYLARLKGEIAPEAKSVPSAQEATPSEPSVVMQEADIQAITSRPESKTTSAAGDRIPGFSPRIGTNTVKRIGEVVDEHPDKALAIFRNWMAQ
jgi:hypothetical protein